MIMWMPAPARRSIAAGASAFGSVTSATSRAWRSIRSSSDVSTGSRAVRLAEPGPQRRVVVRRGERPGHLGIGVVQRHDLELVGEALDRLDPARDVVVVEPDDADPQPTSACRGDPSCRHPQVDSRGSSGSRPARPASPAGARPRRGGRPAPGGLPPRASPARPPGVARSSRPGRRSIDRIRDALARDQAAERRMVVSGVEPRGTADDREQVRPPDRLLDRPEDRVPAWLRRWHGRRHGAHPPQLDAAAGLARAVGLRLLPVFGRHRDRGDDHRRPHHAPPPISHQRPRRERRARGLSTIYDTRAGQEDPSGAPNGSVA